MNGHTIDAWKDYFYSPEDLISDWHIDSIHPSNNNRTDTIRRIDSLVELAFGAHILFRPKYLEIKALPFAEPESKHFFFNRDIDNLFISKYYQYPHFYQVYRNDISKHVTEDIKPTEILEELKGQIADANGIVVLLGEVGEGKTAFLCRLASELKLDVSGQKYYPVVINVQNYNDIIESHDQDRLYGMFWEKVYEYVTSFIQNENNTLTGIEQNESLSDIVDYLTEYTKEEGEIGIFQRLVKAARDLKIRHNIRLVLIFDNLDTFCYEHERFMLFEAGYDKLISKINVVKKIIWYVTNNLLDSEISFMFTARPYVYTQVFNNEVLNTTEGKISAVYRIKEIKHSVPIDSRLDLLLDLANKLKENKTMPVRRMKDIESFIDKFTYEVKRILKLKKIEQYEKNFNLANQGFRSIVKFYGDLEYDPDLFPRYFTHDILYLYMLSMHGLFSQLIPRGHQRNRQMSYFPNMFLIRCDNEYNMSCEDANKKHRLTYWLKYLILAIVSYQKRCNIRTIIDVLNEYEEHAVRLCLGSLATVNESNCLSLEFPEHISSLQEFETYTYVTLTRRGNYLFHNNYCLSLDCLQLYFDDWLMPRPKAELLQLRSIDLGLLKPDISKDYSYNYLLNADNRQHNKLWEIMVEKKVKQSLLLLSILRGALKYEISVYKDSWEKIRAIADRSGNELISDSLILTIQNRIFEEAFRIRSKDLRFKNEMESFAGLLNDNSKQFDDFFNLVKSKTPSR